MNYVNNWLTQLSLPLLAGETELAIPPQAAARLSVGGQYLLTLASSLDPTEQATFEVVLASVGAGHAITLARGQEGTTNTTWPQDSYVFCAPTAGSWTAMAAELDSLRNDQLAAAQQLVEQAVTIEQLQQLVESLTARVEALEAGGSGGEVDGALVDDENNTLTDDEGNTLTGEP